ncbi:GNAT family N-acetyltransferase [Dongia sp.]|uniref:bifunctional helix-turn-helix transcriptional regulator/GNAT family N-acetyltransferase n=1 Tax=Dongia sp. TaxID=1977262 RepID=UPI0037518EDA
MAISSPQDDLERDIAAVRRFNRFYTQKIGVLGEGWLKSPFTLTEARVLYELAHRAVPTAAELARDLGLDAGYLSRILASFEKKKLLKRTPSETDGRRYHLSLTDKGRKTFAPLDEVTRRDVAAILDPMPQAQRQRMVQAMDAIEAAMGTGSEPEGYVLRAPKPGDISLVIARQARLYTEEYGWNGEFEIMANEIAMAFARSFDPKWERCWIVERGGEVVGSIFLVKQSEEIAKLRMLYVDAAARGLGLGKRLVEECVAQARAFGYKRMTLWTNDVLAAARHIYKAQGFKLVKEDRHHMFGKDLVGQTWELDLEANECPAEHRRSA